MAQQQIKYLARFNVTTPQGAFTHPSYGNVVFLITEVLNEAGDVKAYSTTDRQFWEFSGETYVSPAEHVIFYVPTDGGAGFIT